MGAAEVSDGPDQAARDPGLVRRPHVRNRPGISAAVPATRTTLTSPNRVAEIANDVIRVARGRPAFGLMPDADNAWDKYAIALAADHTFGLQDMVDRLHAICCEVLDGLPALERHVLLRTTDEYRFRWDGDAPEPGENEARCWLVGDLAGLITTRAFDHGYCLVEGGESDE